MSLDANLRRWLPLCALGILLPGYAVPAVGQRPVPVTSVWSASAVESHFRRAATASIGQATSRSTLPDTMTFFELRALFATRDSTPRPLQADSVYLVMGSTGHGSIRFPLESIGLVGSDECRWTEFHALAQGAVTTTLGSGDGYELSRSERRGPLTITFQKNPNLTCLLFAIPSRTAGPLRLHFAGSVTAVPRPK